VAGTFEITVTNADNSGVVTNNAFTFVAPPLMPITTHMSTTNTIVISWTNSGWRLFGTTNPLNVGIKSNSTWVELPGYGGSTQAVIPIVKTNPTVFYRLINP
jgi:hypothetical protein